MKNPAADQPPVESLLLRGHFSSSSLTPACFLTIAALVGLSLTASLAKIGLVLLQDAPRTTLADIDASAHSSRVARTHGATGLGPVRLRPLEPATRHAFVIDPLTE